MPRRFPDRSGGANATAGFVQIGKKQHRLDPDREEAFKIYHELMTAGPAEPPTAVPAASQLVVEVLDAFLDRSKLH
jgi:hypothetical protein